MSGSAWKPSWGGEGEVHMEADWGYIIITVLALIGTIPMIGMVLLLGVIYFVLRAIVGD